MKTNLKKSALFILTCILLTGFINAQVLIEAESFIEKGGWVIDQQFMDQMGSPYLMAHGLGEPVRDAKTMVNFPSTGKYRVFVRTFNWTAPWHKGKGPGKFSLLVNGKPLTVELGVSGEQWMWQDAGVEDSVTHVALGTVRVQRTTAMMGEVIGMAASVCRKNNAPPRDVYLKFWDEMKKLMKEGIPEK